MGGYTLSSTRELTARSVSHVGAQILGRWRVGILPDGIRVYMAKSLFI